MAEVLFLLLITLMFLHFIYEGIIAPTLRTELSYKMLALSNRLRGLRAVSNHNDELAFKMICESIDSAIQNLHTFTFTKIYLDRMLSSKSELTTLLNERNLVIERAATPALHEIIDLLDEYLFKALTINCGGLLFWMSPFILIAYIRNRFVKVWSDRVRSIVRSFVFVPENLVIR